jgi:hypothetical protein
MDKPKLLENQFAVGQCELATGIVLDKKNLLRITDSDNSKLFTIFDSFDTAKDFAIKRVTENPEIECWILNSKSEAIFVYDKYGERKTTQLNDNRTSAT